ncbi:MAG: RNA polymerase sigma factor [Rhodothermia bacterium]
MEPTAPTEEQLVERAKQGDKDAPEVLIRRIQDRIYNLAMRMLWHPADAEDATQEILLKIITHLDAFRGESKFSTWCWKITTNHLLTTRKRLAESQAISFETLAEMLDQGLSDGALMIRDDLDERLITEEVRIGCMQGMLLCLNREQRITYILGDIFEITDREGGEMLGITPAGYRKRLSRVRTRLRNFMNRECGLMNPENPCRCRLKANYAIRRGFVNPKSLLFSSHRVRAARRNAPKRIAELTELARLSALFRSHPEYAAPDGLVTAIKTLLSSGRHELLSE